MKQLNLKTEIHYFERFSEFAEEFKVGNRDLVFTRKAFKKYFKPTQNEPIFIYNDDFGKGEPTDKTIDNIVSEINKLRDKFDRVIAVGGGSIIDIGKLLALKDVTSAEQLFFKKIPAVKDKELVIIPTTCGTGSEVTNISIATMESLNTKLGLADDSIFADYAVLIPELLEELPFEVIMNSSIDALVHASESFLSPKATPLSRIYSREAIITILEVYKEIFACGSNAAKVHIGELLFASTYAGIAFGIAGTAVVHAMAYPLGSVYHVPHGEANYQFFIECFKFYMKGKPYGDIRKFVEIISNTLNKGGYEALDCLENLLFKIFPSGNLKELYSMKEEDCKKFAESVVKNQQRLLVNSYIQLTQDEIEQIYKIRY